MGNNGEISNVLVLHKGLSDYLQKRLLLRPCTLGRAIRMMPKKSGRDFTGFLVSLRITNHLCLQRDFLTGYSRLIRWVETSVGCAETMRRTRGKYCVFGSRLM